MYMWQIISNICLIKDSFTIICLKVWESSKEWFTHVSVNHFMPHEDYFHWSTQNVSRLTNILWWVKHSIILLKHFFYKIFYAETNWETIIFSRKHKMPTNLTLILGLDTSLFMHQKRKEDTNSYLKFEFSPIFGWK